MPNKSVFQHGSFLFPAWLSRGSVLLLFVTCASLAMAQLDTGTVSGAVTDQTGAAAPGATVTIRNVGTDVSRRAETDVRGRYEATALPAGNYEVSASLVGFQTIVRRGIDLTVGRNAVVDLLLQVGEVAQAITVTEEASYVETTTATVTNIVDEKRVLDIPLNNRDLTQLAYMQPGVLKIPQGVGTSRSEVGGMGGKLSVAGSRGTQNVYLLDGVSNSDISGNAQSASGAYTGAETIQEFQIITNNYDAEYPSKPGAIVSAVTKSGTNALHGSLFEFLRNDKLDAAKWEDNAFGLQKPAFKRNHFGGSLGGPIIRDRTFFFASYEGLRERLGLTGTATVPSVAGQNGFFQGATYQVPPVIKHYLGLWPVPGQVNALTHMPTTLVKDYGDGTALIAGPELKPTNEDFGAIKINHQFTNQKKGFVAVTYNIDDANSAYSAIMPNSSAISYTSRKHVISARHTSILSPTALNEFTFGYTTTSPSGGVPAYNIDWSSYVFYPQRKYMGEVRPNDITAIGYAAEGSTWGQDLMTFKDGLSLTRTNHTMKMGVEINRFHDPVHTTGGSYNGTYQFNGFANFLQNKALMLDFNLPKGIVAQGQVVRDITDFDLRQTQFGFYFQDNYKMLPSLTWNLGLRYEFITLPTEANGNLAALRHFMDSTTVVGQLFTNPSLRSFSPRFGFAWSPGNHKTSFRGGFGVYYDLPTLYKFQTNFVEMPPITVPGSYQDSNSTGALRFPDAPTTQLDLLIKTPNIRSPEYNQQPTYVYRWNVTLEREMGAWFVSAGYTGSRARGNWLQGNANMNRWIGWPNNVPTAQKRWPATGGIPINPAFNTIYAQSPNGNGSYHGLVVNVVRRLGHGLQFQGAYSFSKAIDQGSGNTNGSDSLPQSQRLAYYWDPSYRKGLAVLDIRNNFVGNLTYDLPRAQLTGFGKAVLNGWQTNAILTLSNGFPFSLTDSNSAQTVAMGQTGGLRPNLIPGGNNNPVLGGPQQYFDVNQFVPSVCFGSTVCKAGDPAYQVGYYGNLGMNTVTGPGLITFDFSLTKNFQLREKTRLQFRAESFNTLNNVNFDIPVSVLFRSNGARNPQAGQITQTRSSGREIQFGLKVIF